ncbi:MAG TPA: hypothetical protein VL475_02805, partial [Planctomycetaceae bacterium]|nr:hypothetical protein [Planctomycetaceae bacterium]
MSSAQAAETEKEVVETLQKLGATVTRDERSPDHPVVGVKFNFNRVPDGLLKRLRLFRQLQALDLSGSYVSEDDLKDLSHFKRLQSLSLRDCALKPAHLKILATLKSLESLDLRHSGVMIAERPDSREQDAPSRPDDAPPRGGGRKPRPAAREQLRSSPLRELAALPKLERLDLGANNLRDENLKDLAGLKHLRVLSLESNYTSLGAGL